MTLLHPVLADSDISGSLIWIVIVIGGFIFSTIKQWMGKSKEANGEEGESAKEKQVRHIIEELKKKKTPTSHSSRNRGERPVYSPPPRVSSSKLERNISSHTHQARGGAACSTMRGENPVDLTVHSERDAAKSMQSLSSVEQEALNKLKKGREPSSLRAPHRGNVSQNISSTGLLSQLKHRDALKMAILYREILGEPVALRQKSTGLGL